MEIRILTLASHCLMLVDYAPLVLLSTGHEGTRNTANKGCPFGGIVVWHMLQVLTSNLQCSGFPVL